MSFQKQSQAFLEGADLPVGDTLLPELDTLEVSDEESLLPLEGILEVKTEPEEEIILTLDKIPGGEDQNDLQVEEPEEVEVIDDPLAWTPSTFLSWLSKMMKQIPPHSGRDTVGIERAMAYLRWLDGEVSKAARADLRNEIAISDLEKARDEIQRGLDRLQERLEIISAKYKKKKRSEEEIDGLTKTANTLYRGVSISVPLFISSLARSCINGMVSAGHDIERIYKQVSEEYNLSKREKLELLQLLQDSGYPMRRDLGMPLDQPIDTSSSDNVNWGSNFPG